MSKNNIQSETVSDRRKNELQIKIREQLEV